METTTDPLEEAFERHRRELHVHCYRMLASYDDAEDAVQESFLRAWRSRESFDGDNARAWLYRIATNVCLDRSRARQRRARAGTEVSWLTPYPDTLLDQVPAEADEPDQVYVARETIELAFLAALQVLPPRQRATLLLTDVLGWSAAESARLLDSSVAAVNSALQRARATLKERLAGRPRIAVSASDEQRALLERYVHAWESTDVDGFTALLKEDAVMSMPPWRQWYRGRAAVAAFFAHTGRRGGHAPFRIVPTAANCQPACAFYSRWQSPEWRFHSVQLLTLHEDSIAAMTSFVMPQLASVFDLPAVLHV